MRQRYWKYVAPALFVLLHCSFGLPFVTAERPEAGGQGTDATNLAVFIEGHVTVKHKGWTGYAPVVFGTSLRSGDLLHLDESSHAKVVCSDLTLHDIPVGIGGVPCSPARPVLQWVDGSAINPTRSGLNDGSFPMVLSPRKTKLLSPYPVLRWTPVSWAASYTVIVRGASFYWSSNAGSLETEMVYPKTAPRLSDRVNYKLIVGTRDRSSEDEAVPFLGFTMLSSEERKAVKKEQQRIEGLGLADAPTQFLVAYLYTTHDLNAEAIQRLEGLSQTFKMAAVARLSGDLYLKVGLVRKAETSYLNSLELCKAEKDEEGEMLVHLSLGRIYKDALGNKGAAIQHVEAALALAEKIGDDLIASQTRKRLTELKRPGV